MKYKVIAVYDSVQELYMGINLDTTEGSAIRNFGTQCTQQEKQKNMFQLYPDNYFLYCFGDFDTKTGDFSLAKKPKLLATARQFCTEKED